MRDSVLSALILVTVLLAYQPAWRGTPVWDDEAHITRVELRPVSGLRSIWLEPGATQQFYPVLHTAFWIEHRLWGDSPLGYHLSNLVLHSTAAFLVFLCLRRLAIPMAAVSALVFALHPIQVESVAWISEQKNTLSAVFALASALWYLRFEENRGARDYAIALVLFLLALGSKSVTATLPGALVAAVWWRRGELAWRRDVAPLVPLFACGLVAGLVTAWVERTFIGARGAEFQLTAIERVLVASRALVFYGWALAWPFGLTFNYPRWRVDAGAWWQYLYPVALAAIAIALWRLRSWSRAPLAAFVAFGVLLFPALGFFDVYPFRYSFVADHFAYLASIPMIAVVCAAAGVVVGRGKRLPYRGAALAAVLIVVLATLTWAEARNYVDAETLYRSILVRNPASWFAHTNLGNLLLGQGRRDDAARHLEEALGLNPEAWELQANVGLLRMQEGASSEAIRHFESALRLNPSYAEARNDLGHVLFRMGKIAEARPHFVEAIRLKPGLAEAHANLAAVLEREGAAEPALAGFREALRLKPDLAEAHLGECRLLLSLQRMEAAAACDEALRRQPQSAGLHYQVGAALFRQRRIDEAIAHFSEAMRLQPDAGQVHNDLGVALAASGRREEAVVEMQASVRLQPGNPDALFNLANLLQQMGRAEESLPFYGRAVAASPSNPAIRNNFGGALQAVGRLAEAKAQFMEALRLKPDFPQARENLERLKK